MCALSDSLASAAKRGDKGQVLELLNRGADVNYAGGWFGIPPLILAVSEGHAEIARLLLERNADKEATASEESCPTAGWTALHHAAERGDCGAISLLLAYNANVNAPTCNGANLTPLHLAAHNGHHRAVMLLLYGGANIEAVEQYNRTSLHLAAGEGHWLIVELFLENGADGSAADHDQKTPIDCSASMMLVTTGSKRKEFYKTTLVLLQDQRAAVCAKKALQWSDLHSAAYTGDVQGVLTLANEHTVGIKDAMSATPLLYAAFSGHAEIIRILARNGGRVDARDLFGQFPVRFAVLNGHFAAAKALVQNGADIDVLDRNRNTPLHDAVRRRNYPQVQMLLSLGADASALDKRGYTPFMIATENRDVDLMLLLTGQADCRIR